MKKIAITAGDPYGIGPELLAVMWQKNLFPQDIEILCYMPQSLARFYQIPLERVRSPQHDFEFDPSRLGQVDGRAGFVSMESFRLAIADALEQKVSAIVTGPVHKQSVALAGEKYLGHTELLQEMTHSPEVLMGFFSPRLNVFLNSIHVPLAQVPQKLNPAGFEAHLRLACEGLRSYGIARPRLAVAGLNPHAGENTLMGTEEKNILLPVIQKLQKEGLQISEPLSGDTVFYRAYHGEFDGVMAMYHDQGLAPLKLIAFDEAVNVTLGTPLIRTSVDHGTGFDIVGQGQASPTSFLSAIAVAKRFINAQA